VFRVWFLEKSHHNVELLRAALFVFPAVTDMRGNSGFCLRRKDIPEDTPEDIPEDIPGVLEDSKDIDRVWIAAHKLNTRLRGQMQDVARHVHDLQQAAFEKDQVRQCLNTVIGKVVKDLKPWTLKPHKGSTVPKRVTKTTGKKKTSPSSSKEPPHIDEAAKKRYKHWPSLSGIVSGVEVLSSDTKKDFIQKVHSTLHRGTRSAHG
jgi:hypothetical protein